MGTREITPPRRQKPATGASDGRPNLADVARELFGPEHGVDLDLPSRNGFRFPPVELERETDGRWFGVIPGIPGVMAYGVTANEARNRTLALGLRVVADRLDDSGATGMLHFECGRRVTDSDLAAVVARVAAAAVEPPAPEMRELLARIVDAYAPRQVWVFGSRARGTARPSSDWDLMVVVDDHVADSMIHDHQAASLLQQGSGAYADIVVVRHADFVEGLSTLNTLAFDVGCEGRLVFQRDVD